MPKLAETDDEIRKCFAVLSELRPHLEESAFLELIRSMEPEGYKLAFEVSEGNVVAVAGFRMYTNLFMGKHLYIDDLVTGSEYRSMGFGEALVSWLRNLALENDCKFLHLDSGTHRGSAHRFYFNQGFTIASYHFSQPLMTR